MAALTKTRRVSRRSPCPICGRPDWCLIAQNGSYAICCREPSPKPAAGESGGWVHALHASKTAPREASSRSNFPEKPTPVAPVERRDRVYHHLLAACPLSGDHRRALLDRGFTPEAIRHRGYGSLSPGARVPVCRALAEMDLLVGIPGFYTGEGGEGSFWALSASPGLLIPVRDRDGRIRAVRLRPDDPRGGGKYRWLSSAGKLGGTGSGVVCHVARPAGAATSDAVWVVEGELKADLAADALGVMVLSVPGVDLWHRILADLETLLPEGGKVVVALDSDWREKAAVHRAMAALAMTCKALGFRTKVALWDSNWKGLDDLLKAGGRPKLCSADSIPRPKWVGRESSRLLAELPETVKPAMSLHAMREALSAALVDKAACQPPFA